MVDGEGQLRIFAVVSFLHCVYREQAHAGAVIDPRLQAAKVFRMTEVVVIVIALDERTFGRRSRKLDNLAHDRTGSASAAAASAIVFRKASIHFSV
jgi:hypothetical protein